MIVAALIVSTTLLAIFAPAMVAWLVGILLVLAVLAAFLGFIAWIFGGFLGDIAGIVQVVWGRPTDSSLPWTDTARVLAIIFGPIIVAWGLSLALPDAFAEALSLAVLVAYAAVAIYLFREFRKT